MRQQLYVTSMGAKTSLGNTVTACAAARAGLSRPAPCGRDVVGAEEGSTPLIGHPVTTVSGFQGEARLLALALPALLELLKEAGPTPLEQTGFCLALPDLASRAKLSESTIPSPVGLVDRILEMTVLSTNPTLIKTFRNGPVGFALAMQAGMEILAAGQAASAIIGAVDTLCDDVALDALAAQDRLKGGDRPVGLQPGEGAAFVLLESSEGARRRAKKPVGSLKGIGIGRESGGAEDPPHGQGLRDAVVQMVAESGPLPVGGSWFILDLNGEERRAHDWGCCYTKLRVALPGLLPAPEWYPATSLGDAGTANAALGVQIAIRAFSRGYSPGTCAVVLSSSDDGGRAAVSIEKAT